MWRDKGVAHNVVPAISALQDITSPIALTYSMSRPDNVVADNDVTILCQINIAGLL
ncbi:hypothetical protein J6590_006403 [Homalodisca vitripennis]|nr:hypothetical protein J6590_006403 [Homalodisca vitripennis]